MVIKGQAHWAKIVGKPGWGYKQQYKEWSMDVAIDADTRAALIKAGCDGSYIKNKGDDRGDFVTFKRRELKADGTAGKPIAIEQKDGSEWDQKTLIGNGSTVLCKIALNDRQDSNTKKPGLIKVRVMELVPYEGKDREEDIDDYVEAHGGEEEWS